VPRGAQHSGDLAHPVRDDLGQPVVRAHPDPVFRQGANGGWGSGTDRMGTAISATSLCKALTGVTGRDGIEPTLVAPAGQCTAGPEHCAKHWDGAIAVVAKLAA